ncbi:MAG: efflux RND transporter periplasmic adaptor subunit [Verrucomicrobiota bacterium]
MKRLIHLFSLLALGSASFAAEEPERRILPVETVEAVVASQFVETRTFLGKVEAARSSQLGFELAGTVTFLGFEEGESVTAGQVIARLDNSRLEAQRLQLQAAYEEAASVERLATITFKRFGNLVATNSVSTQQYDEAKQKRDSAKASLDSIQAQIQVVDVDLGKSTLKAPYAGVISRRFMDEGTIVSPGAPIFEILETGEMEIRAGVSAQAALAVKIGDKFKIGDIKATLIRAIPMRETRTRTIDLILKVESADRPLIAGDLVEVPVRQKTNIEGFWLPRTALTESRRGLWACYVAQPTGDDEGVSQLERRQIEVLYASTNHVYVRGAVNPGEQVVSGGLHKLTPGQHVASRMVAQVELPNDRKP